MCLELTSEGSSILCGMFTDDWKGLTREQVSIQSDTNYILALRAVALGFLFLCSKNKNQPLYHQLPQSRDGLQHPPPPSIRPALSATSLCSGSMKFEIIFSGFPLFFQVLFQGQRKVWNRRESTQL